MFGLIFNHLIKQAQQNNKTNETETETTTESTGGQTMGQLNRDEIDPRYPTQPLKNQGILLIVGAYAAFGLEVIFFIKHLLHSAERISRTTVGPFHYGPIWIVIPLGILLLIYAGYIHRAAQYAARGSLLHFGPLSMLILTPLCAPICNLPLAWRDKATPQSRITTAIIVAIASQILTFIVLSTGIYYGLPALLVAGFGAKLASSVTAGDHKATDAVVRFRASGGLQVLILIVGLIIGWTFAMAIDAWMMANIWIPIRLVPIFFIGNDDDHPYGRTILYALGGYWSSLAQDSQQNTAERKFAADQPDESEELEESEEEAETTDPEPVSDQFKPDEEASEESKDEQIARLKRELEEKKG